MAYKTRRRPETVLNRARSLRDAGNLAEALLWNELKNRKLGGYKFVRQMPLGKYYADFLCRERKLVVEIDGSQHAGSSYDRRRDAVMRADGYSVIRFWTSDVLKCREQVCATILAALEGRLDEDLTTSDLRYVRAPHD